MGQGRRGKGPEDRRGFVEEAVACKGCPKWVEHSTAGREEGCTHMQGAPEEQGVER